MYSYDKPDNLVDMFEQSIGKYSQRPLFGTPDEIGNYTWQTYAQVGKRVDDLRAGLSQLDIQSGDTVGIIADNRTEWAVAAIATFGLGARFIPMYEKERSHTWKYIIEDGDIKVLFAANETIMLRVQRFRNDVSSLEHVVLIDGSTVTNMSDIETKGRANPVDAIHPTPSDLAVIIYTSGTTGAPKGVKLTHGNLTSNFIAGGAMFPELNYESRSLSILPWAHSYGQTAELYNFMNLGGSIGFIRDITTIGDDMAKVAPTFLIAVPRVFNKIYDGLMTKMKETGGIALKLFNMGLESAVRIRTMSGQGSVGLITKLKYKLADRIVFSKIRQRFGGQLRGALTASATMNLEVSKFFTDIGLPVFDAYGLTETSPAVTMNNREASKPGSVGRAIDKVRVVINNSVAENESGEGEVVVYGPNVMLGYHNQPEATKAVMTEDGGFRTGDLGRLDDDGFLYITGRIKEQYKLENGKYVFPAGIEEEIQLSEWVENVLIFGEGRSHNVCLVVPDFLKLTAWAEKEGVDAKTPAQLISLPQVENMIKASVIGILKHKYGGYEIPKKIILVEEPFSVDNGMLTQTLKLKRRKVLEQYMDQINSAYESACPQ